MKSILSAAALLVAIASPALAEEATGTQAQPAPAVVEIVPAATATEPAMSEAQRRRCRRRDPVQGRHGRPRLRLEEDGLPDQLTPAHH